MRFEAGRTKKKTIVATIITMSMLLSACSVDIGRAKDALTNLGDDLTDAIRKDPVETEVIEETDPTVEDVTPDVEPPVIVEPTEAPEPTATPAPTATPTPSPVPTSTPIPTPTQMPERVDMSDLTEDTIADGITVKNEQFRESYVMDNVDEISRFEGNRLLLESEEDSMAVRVINLYLHSLYAEADGLYRSNLDSMIAQYMLEHGTLIEGVVFEEIIVDENVSDEEDEKDVEVDEEDIEDEDEADDVDVDEDDDSEEAEEIEEEPEIYPDGIRPYDKHLSSVIYYRYNSNGRILTVSMGYEVSISGEVIATSSDRVMFDIYTGQVITEDMLIADRDGFNAAMVAALLESASDDTDERDITDVKYVITQKDDGEKVILVAGVANGEEIYAIFAIDENIDLFTRYGRITLK